MEKILIGAHTSAAKGSFNALYEGQRIGATTVQLFTSNQKQWTGRAISEEEVQKWEKALDETGISQVMSHDSYLINLGSVSPELLQKSKKAFSEELQRCHQLNITYLNFHPGAATTGTTEQCIETIIQSLLELAPLINSGKTKLLLETTAGQGTSVGHRFEHLAAIIEGVKHKIEIGVCIDTCHIFAAGYDIRTPQKWDKTLAAFDQVIGSEYLCAFHINDSMKEFASRRDRHAPLGEGEIGMESFEYLMQIHPAPKYLETPGGPPRWTEEIAHLKKVCNEKKSNTSSTPL